MKTWRIETEGRVLGFLRARQWGGALLQGWAKFGPLPLTVTLVK